MNHRSNSLTLPLCLVMALLAAFLFTSPAFAQDEVPPAPEEVPAETELAETLAETGVVLADENGKPVPLATEEAAKLLAGNDPWFKVGTTKYSYMFDTECPAGTLDVTCFESANPIQSAVDDIYNGVFIPTDGTLYFDGGSTYNVDQVVIRGTPALKKLVGATDPATGEPTVTINLGSYFGIYYQAAFTMSGFNIYGDTTLNGEDYGALDIWGNSGTLTLTDLVVRNYASNGTGIIINDHTGAVILQNVDSSNNQGGGLSINNYDGSIAPITIKNSSFDDNHGNSSFANGISISTRGAVTLDGVSASGNDGVYIEPELGDQSLAALQLWDSGNLIIKNSVFNYNDSWAINTYNHPTGTLVMDNVYANWNLAGIGLDPKGNITIGSLHADGNDYQGAMLDTCWEDETGACTNPGTGNVVISYSSFNDNRSNFVGLFVKAKGAITLNNVDANGNRGYDRDTGDPIYSTAGARLYNHLAASAYPVTVNYSSFNWNSEDGLEIYSKGLVTINAVRAQDNSIERDEFGNYVASHDGYGLQIDNTSGTTAGVTFKGVNWGDNEVSRNSYGLHVRTNGAVLMSYLNSFENSHTNTVIDNTDGTGAVTVSNSSFRSSFWGDGIDIFTNGVVTLNNVGGHWNYIDGIYIDNRTAAPKAVTINGGNARGNGANGLTIYTNGAITVKDFWGEENGSWGAYLTNYDSVTPVPVTMTNCAFKGNSGDGGLYVQSKGAVKLTNVGASENSYRGGTIVFDDVVSDVVGNQYADNWWFDGLQDQVINFGLIRGMPESWGEFNITLYDMDGNYLTSYNYRDGNDYNFALMDYTLPFDGQYRIEVNYWGDGSGAYEAYFWQGTGDYAGAGFVTDWDWVKGAYIDNTDGAGVTITNPVDSWDYKFNLNTDYGLNILSKGAVKLTNVNASSNVGYGALINNKAMTAAGGVTVAGGKFAFNGEFGLQALTNGVVSITKTQAYRNNGLGLDIENIPLAGTANPAVTIVNDANRVDWWDYNFRMNGNGGLLITSRGTVTLTNVNASNNGHIGAQVNNTAGTADVKITNGYFYENSHNGLDVLTKGNIIYTKGRAENNWNGEYDDAGRGIGLNLVITNNVALKNITITDVSLYNNFKYGVIASTRGNITLTKVFADNNWGYEAGGALLDNLNGTGSIIITASSFSNNNLDGLRLHSKGNVTLNNVSVDGNRGYGAVIGSAPNPVKVVSILGMSHFNGNQNTGLEVHASGAITLANVDAGNNGGNGAYLNNTYGMLPANISLLATLANWSNWYGDNGWNYGGNGMEIHTNGAVVLNKLDASNNKISGVYISNETAGVPANVTINTGNFNNNRNGSGLVVFTKGTVLLSGLVANDNQFGPGAYIDNRFDTTSTKSVTVNKSEFSNNRGTGLQVYSCGNIVVNGISATNNSDGAPGVSLNNNEGTGTVSVLSTLGWNVFNNNDASGLAINSSRAVTISGVTAEGSRSGYGITIDNNQAGGGIGNVTLSKVYANHNRFEGLMIDTNGVASLSGVSVMFNGLDDPDTGDVEIANGITIHSHNALSKVTITASAVIGNGANGIRIYKYGGPAPMITTTAYFGNDANYAGYSNLLITN